MSSVVALLIDETCAVSPAVSRAVPPAVSPAVSPAAFPATSPASSRGPSPTPEEHALFYKRGPPAPGMSQAVTKKKRVSESDSDFVPDSGKESDTPSPAPKRRLRSRKAPATVPTTGPLSISHSPPSGPLAGIPDPEPDSPLFQVTRRLWTRTPLQRVARGT